MMNNQLETLKSLIQYSENEIVEFKEAKTKYAI